MKRFLAIITLISLLHGLQAQPLEPSHWRYTVEEITAESAVLCFDVELDDGWHIYSTRTESGGPLATEFEFTASKNYSLAGGIEEPKPHEQFDELFNVTVRDFSGSVRFRQKIKRKSSDSFAVEGSVSFQLCNDGNCIAPEDHPFRFEVPAVERAQLSVVETPQGDDSTVSTVEESIIQEPPAILDSRSEEGGTTDNNRGSLWKAFVLALLAGVLTMLTPCVFPMVPMTVNYFVRGGKRRQAWIFGGSIVLIFSVLGALLTLIFGSETLYFLGTHWVPNMIFFIIFLVFALSFFGLFEIQLPTGWINRSEAKADKGGWLAPFFMALTTVLVSFSCTGPILGAALVGLTTSMASAWVSLLTMLGFGIGFALPFTLIALFPSWLKRMKSGSWLNSVKVSFAFLELAFSLKFLSMADLYCGWGLLDREIYLCLWIVIFALLGAYLLGKIRFKDDSEVTHIGIARLFMVIVDLAFVVYMIPGLFGAPLKAISGFLPPMETQDFNIGRIVDEGSHRTNSESTQAALPHLYADQLHLPVGFEGYFDLDEAKAEARRTGKPIFIDFTGITCANCREMEHYVWADKEVKQLLNNEFVICALFVDANNIELPEEQWITTEEGRTLRSVGRRNLHLEKTLYNMNAQPYYVVTDADGNTLTANNYQYNRNPRQFEAWLREALANFNSD